MSCLRRRQLLSAPVALGVVLVLLNLAGCPQPCDPDAPNRIEIFVSDAATRTDLDTADVFLVGRPGEGDPDNPVVDQPGGDDDEGPIIDQSGDGFDFAGAGQYFLSADQPGIYTVVIAAPEYQTRVVTVNVAQDDCGVIAATRFVELELRSPNPNPFPDP